MKKILLVSCLALVGLAAYAQSVTLLSNHVVYQGTDSNLATKPIIDCRGQKSVALQWTVTHSGTATAAEGIALRPSFDASTAAGNELFMFVITPASTTPTTWVTNLTVNGYPYLLITYLTNIDADTYSTNTIKYWVKKNAP